MKERTKENSLANKISWWFYSLKIKIFKPRKSKIEMNQKTKKNLFLLVLLVFPIIQFLIFYVGVNFNSILLAFQKYENRKYVFAGFENFAQVWSDIFETGALLLSIKNSAIQLLLTMLVMMPINILSSYVIFKKCPFSGFIKVMLFMPNMIAAMVFVINARVLILKGFPLIFDVPVGGLLNKHTSSSFYTVLIFGSWMRFASGLIVYLSAMSSIPKDVIEYGELEPMSSIQELLHIVLPSIWPTIVTYVVVNIAGFFTDAGFFHAFFGGDAKTQTPFDTLGYTFFVKVVGDRVTLSDYPYASAAGVLFTAFVAPVTLTIKYLMEKYGPSED